jgi:hypothetical protein
MKHPAWKLAVSLALILQTVRLLHAQGLLDKKSTVTVVIPASVLKPDGLKSGWNVVHPIYAVEIVRAPSGQPIPKDKPDWRTSGFPMLRMVNFEKMEQKDGVTVVEYRSPETRGRGIVAGVVVKFKMAAGQNPEEMVRSFIIGGEPGSPQVQAYLAECYQLIASRVFAGTLASVADRDRLALVGLAHVTAKGVGLSAESYKDNTYFAVDLADDGNVYNDLKLNEGQRVSQITNERLLSVIKAFAAPLRTSASIYGVKLHALVVHEDFLRKGDTRSTDDISLYAPAELIRKFADADITSQEFIDGCVVIVNGNRVKVVLALT